MEEVGTPDIVSDMSTKGDIERYYEEWVRYKYFEKLHRRYSTIAYLLGHI